MDPTILAAALGPLALDLFRSIKEKFFPSTDYKPATFQEWMQMQQMRTDQFKAMQDSGAPTGVLWADLFLRLQKPALATLAFLLFGYQETFLPGGATENVLNIAGAFGFWLLGEEGKNVFNSWRLNKQVQTTGAK